MVLCKLDCDSNDFELPNGKITQLRLAGSSVLREDVMFANRMGAWSDVTFSRYSPGPTNTSVRLSYRINFRTVLVIGARYLPPNRKRPRLHTLSVKINVRQNMCGYTLCLPCRPPLPIFRHWCSRKRNIAPSSHSVCKHPRTR